MPPTSRRVNRLTLREQVLKQLREAIITGEFRAGTILTEMDLAERFDVSRGTVREALRTLQNAGLVTGGPRGAQRVHTPDEREIFELYRVRAALEGLALREVITSSQREEYAAQIFEALPTTESTTFVDALESDLAFHELLCTLSGNSILLASWKRLEDQMRVVLLSSGHTEPLDLMSYDHHLPIVEAIKAGDLDQATHLIYQHMDTAAHQWASTRSAQS